MDAAGLRSGNLQLRAFFVLSRVGDTTPTLTGRHSRAPVSFGWSHTSPRESFYKAVASKNCYLTHILRVSPRTCWPTGTDSQRCCWTYIWHIRSSLIQSPEYYSSLKVMIAIYWMLFKCFTHVLVYTKAYRPCRLFIHGSDPGMSRLKQIASAGQRDRGGTVASMVPYISKITRRCNGGCNYHVCHWI